jgi:hypothetical protein
MSRLLWLLVPCLFSAGCTCAPAGGNSGGPAGGTAAGPSGGGQTAQTDETLDVYEAVFRYRLKNRPADTVAYLEVKGKDLPAELLQRLRKDWPNLKPATEQPKNEGLRVYLEDLKWGRAGTAEVRAGHYFPTQFGHQGYFADHHLIRDKGRWVVERLTNETSS